MTLKSIRMRRVAINLSLLLTALLIGIVACEIFLRLFYPKYEGVAEAKYTPNEMQIWANQPNSRDQRRHPDTGLYHLLYRNNLGLRQHRDFSETDIESAINVGVFGDSFTENVRMASQYSFNEPLDYLLNLSGERFNVLNLGVDGYGTGQSFLQYENFRYAADLDYVFYLFVSNDLRNIYETGLFSLDEAGHLRRNEVIRSSWWIRFVSRLHVSYLVLDVVNRLPNSANQLERELAERMRIGGITNLAEERRNRSHDTTAEAIEDYFERGLNSGELRSSVIVFQELMRLWKQTVEEKGGEFYIVITPRIDEQPVAAIIDDDFEVIDLYDCFGDYDNDFAQREWEDQPYRFRNNGHWNETGNHLAAVCIYRILEREASLPILSVGELWEASYRYYSAFGQMTDEAYMKEAIVSSQELVSIRRKYQALENGESQ